MAVQSVSHTPAPTAHHAPPPKPQAAHQNAHPPSPPPPPPKSEHKGQNVDTHA
ncbi:MAG: hypothetical protein AB7H77_11800 [Bdellovibrionales bacterium]